MRNKKNIKIFCHGRFHFLLFSLENNNLEKYKKVTCTDSCIYKSMTIDGYCSLPGWIIICIIINPLYKQICKCVGVLYGAQHCWQTLQQSLQAYPKPYHEYPSLIHSEFCYKCKKLPSVLLLSLCSMVILFLSLCRLNKIGAVWLRSRNSVFVIPISTEFSPPNIFF